MPDELYEGFFIAKLKKVGKSNLKYRKASRKTGADININSFERNDTAWQKLK